MANNASKNSKRLSTVKDSITCHDAVSLLFTLPNPTNLV